MLLEAMNYDEGHGFWSLLEKQSNIASKRWRQAYSRKQRPTSDMLEALGKIKPTYAYSE